MNSEKKRGKKLQRKKDSRLFFRILIVIVFSLSIFGLIAPIALRPNLYSISLNQISQSDIQAPYTLEYISEIKTEAARATAEQDVELVFSPVPSVRKTQIILLQSCLDSISSILNNPNSMYSDKSEALQAIPEVDFSSEQVFHLVNISDEKWSLIKEESVRVLNSVMSEMIKESQVSQRINNLPIDYVNFSESENALIISLVKPFVVATYFYDSEATNLQRQSAIASVEPVKETKKSGEILVRKGQQITPEIYESLKVYNLIGGNTKWQDIIAASAISLVVFISILLFLKNTNNKINDKKSIVIISAFIYIIFLFSSRFVIPNRVVIPYLFPIPAFGMLMAIIFSPEIGILFSLSLSILVGFNISSGLEISTYYFLCSLCGILSLGKAKRVASFFLSGLMIGLIGSLILISFRLPNPLNDWIGLLTLSGAAFACGLASSSITLLLQFVLSHLLGLTTPLRLIDLSRSDHPLLQFLLQNAPGTYQHSLLVANMTERAVADIGGNALLARVGALYHDVGKAVNPGFFIENQPPAKENPHDRLTPEKSANIIINHVTDGYQLAKKYHLPKNIIDFILEHHGTLLTRYQFTRALQESEIKKRKLDSERFRYPGPSPKSIETTILMLADQSEARVRAEMPIDESQIKGIVSKVIEYTQQENQLSESNITFKQLFQIRDSLTSSLQNTYHPRIRYPEDSLGMKPIDNQEP